jgi:hypothetical protein
MAVGEKGEVEGGAMKRVLILAAILSGMTLSAAATPAPAGRPARNHVTSNESFAARNGARRVTLTVSRDADKMTLRLRVQLIRGMVQWRLFDPSGASRDEGEVVPGPGLDDVRTVPAAEGCWVLEINWLGATGSHDVDWRVQ